MYYDTRDGLINRGVNLQPKVQVCPSPFPASQGRGCPVPPGWNKTTNTQQTNGNKQTSGDHSSNKKSKKTKEISKLEIQQLKEEAKRILGEDGVKAIEKILQKS